MSTVVLPGQSGRLTSVTDFAGRSASLRYTSSNRTSVPQPDPVGAGLLTESISNLPGSLLEQELTEATE